MSVLTPDLDDLVNAADAAGIVGVSASTLRTWASRGTAAGKLERAGLDDRGRPLYRLIDAMRLERATRRRTQGAPRGGSK